MDPVIDRQKSVATVLSTHRRCARSTARALRRLIGPVLSAGHSAPDFLDLQRCLADTLDHHWRHLVAADERCDDARSARHHRIQQRDREVALLYREVGNLRTRLRGRFGLAPSQTFLGLRGETSRDPVVLLRQANRAVARLRDGNRATPSSKLPDPDVSVRNRWAEPVEEAAEALRATVDQVTTDVKRLDVARLERKRALEAFNEAFVRIAGLFEAIYRVVGRTDLAEGVRPSKQRPGWLHHEDKARSRAKSGAEKTPGRLLSFKTLRRAWRRLPGRRQFG